MAQQPQLRSDDSRRRIWVEQGHLVQQNYQPSRSAVLAEVKSRRDNPGSVRKLEFGIAALTIPQLDYSRLCKMFPDLLAPDGHTQTVAWRKFMASSMSEPYRNHPGRNAYRGK